LRGDKNLNKQFIAHFREKDGVPQFLWDHLKETSDLAGKNAAKIGLKEHGQLLGLLHDLGKATVEFDRYIRSATGILESDEDDYVSVSEKKGKIDHASAGAQVIYHHFLEKGNEGLLTAQILSLVVASHHSGLIDCLSPDGEDNYTKRMNKSDEKTRLVEALTNIDYTIKETFEKLIHDESIINKLVEKMNEIKEEKRDFENIKVDSFKLGLLQRFLFSCLIDADRSNTADFEFPEMAKLRNQWDYKLWPVLIKKLNLYLSKFENRNKVDILRQDISNCCFNFSNRPKGLYQLTVPTGGGKTLSSLRFSLNHAEKHQMDRIIYVIPYTSIIDQNAETVRQILEDRTEKGDYLSNIVLEHHSNLTPEEETTRQRLLAENWDAPIVFTTMVQFLEALFGYGTRSARRMHQLANAVIIFDEIQTLPVQCVHLFNVAIRFLIQGCGSSIVLCTATQPLLNKIEPEQRALSITPEQQIMPNVQRLFEELKRVEVYNLCKVGGWTEPEVAELANQELQETGSVLIIVNTKKSAVSLYQLLKSNTPNAKIFHLSTNMCPAHRMEFLGRVKKCLEDEEPIICVSTQLIEAGVDIDFGSVIRYLAGLDSIAQAAGRCNRNGIRVKPGRVSIVNPKDENLDRLKDIKIGRDKAERVLEEFKSNPAEFDKDIIGLKAMERYYQYYFYERKEEMCYKVFGKSNVGRSDDLFELLSTNKLSVAAYQRQNQDSSPPLFLRQSFMTASKAFQAIDSYTRGVIVPYNEGEEIINELRNADNLEKQYKLIKKAQRYSVNVFSYMFEKLMQQRIIYEVQKDIGIFCLDKRYYSNEYGMSEEPVNEMEFLNC
jgi:CRISPR-associated endonuclease/helicase Cas3